MTEQELGEMSDEEVIEVVSALKANDKTMKDSGISDNLWGKAVECIMFLQSENASLRERAERSVDKEQIAKLLAGMFGCPCDYFPLDEEMFEYCDDCGMDNVVCWEKVIDKKSARLAELKGGTQ